MHEVVSLDDSDSKPGSDEQDVTRFRAREEVPMHLQGCEEWNSVKDCPSNSSVEGCFPQRKVSHASPASNWLGDARALAGRTGTTAG
jgi:hypothetical protein